MPTTGIIYADPSFRTRRAQYRISLQSRCPAFRIVFSEPFVCTVTHITVALAGGSVRRLRMIQTASSRRPITVEVHLDGMRQTIVGQGDRQVGLPEAVQGQA